MTDPSSPEVASVTLPGTVEKVIKSPIPGIPEKAQISVDGASDLYRDIRIDNTVQTEDGKKVALQVGAEVKVTIEAPTAATTPTGVRGADK